MNVLIVDDNPSHLRQLRPVLEADGQTVFDAADGVEALKVCEEEKIDALISDVLMPRMDGYRLCSAVRNHSRLKELPFIIYTDGYISASDEKHSHDIGADLHVRRSSSSVSILAALHEATKTLTRKPLPVPEPSGQLSLMKEYNEWLVTKLEEQHAELQAKDEETRHLLAHIPAVIFTLQLQGSEWILQVVTQSIQSMLGFTIEESQNPGWFVDHLHPEDKLRALATLPQNFSSAKRIVEYRMRHKDGNYRWLEDSRRGSDQPSQGSSVVGLWVDITDRKTGEEALKQSERRFAKAFQASPASVSICTYPEGVYLDVNEHFISSLGYPREEVIGHRIADREIWENPGQPVEILCAIEKGEQVRGLECVMRCKSGKLLSTFLSAEKIELDNQQCLLFINYDVTAHKLVEQKLRGSEQRFRQLAENVNEVFWVSNKDFTEIQYVNSAYETIWGRTCQSLYDHPMSFSEAVHPLDYEKFLSILARQKRGEASDEKYRIVRPDGSERWIRKRSFPIKNEAGEFYRIGGVAEDITERQKNENLAFRSQRLEAIGTLAGGLAHDLNNALAPIMMGVELLRMQYPGECATMDMFQASAQRGADMVRQLVTFAKGAEGERIAV